MFPAKTHTTTNRTALRAIGRVDIDHLQAYRLSLVLDKALQLTPRPAVQAGAHPLSGFYSLSEVSEIFHHNGRSATAQRLINNRLAGFVINVGHMPPFTPGDFLKQLPSRLGTVDLKAATKSKEPIAVIAKRPPTDKLAGRGGDQYILAHIAPHYAATVKRGGIGQIEDKVEIPLLSLANQLRFLGPTRGEIGKLKITQRHFNDLATRQAVERNSFLFDGVGARIEVDAASRFK